MLCIAIDILIEPSAVQSDRLAYIESTILGMLTSVDRYDDTPAE